MICSTILLLMYVQSVSRFFFFKLLQTMLQYTSSYIYIFIHWHFHFWWIYSQKWECRATV